MKRIIDIVAALCGLLILSPLFLFIAVIIWLCLGTPILFRQIRPGLHGRLFTLIKFRTMTNATDVNGQELPDAERLTWLGGALRRTSLDEIPELWNVLKGEMSLVGPRPLLTEYLPLYSPSHARRHQVRPGLTGWAQINGRNAISWQQKLDYDVWYVDHQCLSLDLAILARSVMKVFEADGISQQGHATSEKYRGSAE